jgi:hypothetical protein
MRTMNKGLAMSGMWTNPQFKDMGGLVRRMEELEMVHFEPVYRGTGTEVPKKVIVVGDKSDVAYCVPTKKYTIVQNLEVLVPLAIALDRMNVEFSGSILEADGTMYGFFQVGAPIEVGHETFRSCIEVHNSYNCELSFGGASALTRTLCMNGMIQVAGLCDKVKQRHMACVSDAVNEWEKAIMANQTSPEKLQVLINDNLAKTILWSQLEAILMATGIGEMNTKRITEDIENLCPEIISLGLNAWTLYCAITGYYSHRQKASIHTNREGLIKANNLLERTPGEMYLSGIKIMSTP